MAAAGLSRLETRAGGRRLCPARHRCGRSNRWCRSRLGSRRRAIFSAIRAAKGTILGFHARGSEEIVAIEECPVLAPGIVAKLPAIRTIANARPEAVEAGARHRPPRRQRPRYRHHRRRQARPEGAGAARRVRHRPILRPPHRRRRRSLPQPPAGNRGGTGVALAHPRRFRAGGKGCGGGAGRSRRRPRRRRRAGRRSVRRHRHLRLPPREAGRRHRRRERRAARRRDRSRGAQGDRHQAGDRAAARSFHQPAVADRNSTRSARSSSIRRRRAPRRRPRRSRSRRSQRSSPSPATRRRLPATPAFSSTAATG